MLSTSTFDLLAWTAVSWLLVRALSGRHGTRTWVAVGVAAGVGLQNKALVAFPLAGLAVGLLVAGPRDVLRLPGPWVAAALTLLMWAPYVAWQATHGWPLLALSEAIAGGSSGSSEPPWLFVPFQLVLVSPFLVPMWVAGWWRLARDPALRAYRAFAVAFVVLAIVFTVTGGKPYYLAGLYPVLLAAGAQPVLRWAAGPGRRALLGTALALSAATSAVLTLPLVPAPVLTATPIVEIYGEFTALPPAERTTAAVLTANYGQAGAVDRFGPGLGLPPAHSGHNSYADWRTPPETATTAIVLGYDRDALRRWFGSVELAARVDNGIGLDNNEQGTPVWVCRDRHGSWGELWPDIRHVS
jgi:hypothetical protein